LTGTPKQSDNSTRFARQILIPVYCPGCQNLPHVMRSRVCLCAWLPANLI